MAVAGGGGVALFDSMGNAWTANYLKITGDLAVDLHSNIAAEARAKIVYERLIAFTDDKGSKEALQFLMSREITHMRAFAAALESMEKSQFSIGIIEPTPGLVDEYFNASTGESQYGETDQVGPWNSSNGLHTVESEIEGGEGLASSHTLLSPAQKKPHQLIPLQSDSSQTASREKQPSRHETGSQEVWENPLSA